MTPPTGRERWRAFAWLAVDGDLRQFASPCRGEGCTAESCGHVTSADGVWWGCCPFTAMARDRAWGAGLRTYNAAQANPLSDWPHMYAAYVVDIVTAIEDVKAEKARRDSEARASSGRGRR